MFTGIITDIGHIELVEQQGDTSFTIKTHYKASDIEIGASIACAGVCLTVTAKGEAVGVNINDRVGWFTVDVSEETLSKTLISNWQRGDYINLERSLQYGDEMGGHIVTGHVDAVAKITKITQIGDSHGITVRVDKKYTPYIVEKGSITLNGVSLTVNQVFENNFEVNIIPHTWEFTTFHGLNEGDDVHLEIDNMARYAIKLIKSGHFDKYINREILEKDLQTSKEK